MNHNMQQPVGTGMGTQLLWVFASTRGRIGRQVYWLAWVVINAIALAIMFLAFPSDLDAERIIAAGELPGSMQLISLISTILYMIIGIKRLHDFNATGLFTIAFVIPVINIFALVLLGIVPGTAGPNRFGEYTDRIPPPGV